MDDPLTVVVVLIAAGYLLFFLVGLLITRLRYRKLLKFIPELIKEKQLDPSRTYLISGNAAPGVLLLSFTEHGIRLTLLTNYWIPKLSLLNKDIIVKYKDIEYVLYIPRFVFDLKLKKDVASLFKQTLGSFTSSIALPWTYKITDHSLHNLTWLNGKLYQEIKTEFESHGVELRLKATSEHNRRNSYILLAFTIIAVAVSLIFILADR